MKVAAGQFAVGESWRENLTTAWKFIDDAEARSVDLLVLPEGILARFHTRRDRILTTAQPLSGAFVEALRRRTTGKRVTGRGRHPRSLR